MLSHPPNKSTSTPVLANSHSDGQPHSLSALPLVINTFITRWTEHKITLRLRHADRKLKAVSATLCHCALRGRRLQRITLTYQKDKFTIKKKMCASVRLPPTVLSTSNVNVYPCVLMSSPLHLHLLNFAEGNIMSTVQLSWNHPKESNHLLWTTHVFPHTPPAWTLLTSQLCICKNHDPLYRTGWCLSSLWRCAEFRASPAAWAKFLTRWYVGRSSRRGPLWCRVSTVRQAAAAAVVILIHLAALSPLSQTVYRFI